MGLCMKWAQWIGLVFILLSGGISIFWGISIARATTGGPIDFKAVYYGARCLLQHHNPYAESELDEVYRAEDGASPKESLQHHRLVTLFVNLPTTLLFIVPFAMLPFWFAQALWLFLLSAVLFLAAFLMWDIAGRNASAVSLFLVCILLANCEVLFGTGNTAGIVVGLCVVAVWCFLEERFLLIGIFCLAASLAIKPHDSGLVWLYFILAGGVYRKRALQALSITVVLGLSAFLWVSHVAPDWMLHWHSNLAAISGPGGLNEAGPGSLTSHTAGMVIDLQAGLSIFRDDPRFYNPASYLICGAMLTVWSLYSLRTRFTPVRAWFALAAVVPITMLVTYHRPYDAKLLLLTVPACAFLWAEGGLIGWIALAANTLGLVLTGDVPLAVVIGFANNCHINTSGVFGKILMLVMTRPASLVLTVMGIFYLWMYVRRAKPDLEGGKIQTI